MREMGWSGYFEYDGIEVINTSRTEAYAKHLPWFKGVYNDEDLPRMLGHAPYTSPAGDFAPWFDPDNINSQGFYGAYPLSVTGIEDSTRESVVTQSVNDGGNVGRLRNATRSVVFSVALIADGECSAEYGFNWLKQALLGQQCPPSTPGCGGASLRYFSCAPHGNVPPPPLVEAVIDGSQYNNEDSTQFVDGGSPTNNGGTIFDGGSPSVTGTFLTPPVPPPFTDPSVPDVTGLLDEFERNLRMVVINDGPIVVRKAPLATCGGETWLVSFTAVAGTPWEFGKPQPIITGFMDPDVTDPWAAGVTGGIFNADGFAFDDDACPTPAYTPIYDPLCPALIVPPTPPDVRLGCYTVNDSWWRRTITIPDQYIPSIGEKVPVLRVHANQGTLRQLRLRFYRDVDDNGVPDDLCQPVGDLVVSYVPSGTTLVFDGVAEAIYILDANNNARRADTLVYSNDGKPFDWFSLSCGDGYVITADLPAQATATPALDVSLVSRAA